ncbi:hypothetical protein CRG98_000309 [Punica granatum]|uniref:Uncharacterized protein n=1 Tax=Punica granatum TaxID=22663 RepID=A0A2I0LF47_PUNGR|nr:hypothetical protein CRG98_000309 [Punica granatum]
MASSDSFSRASAASPREGGHSQAALHRRAHACPDEIKIRSPVTQSCAHWENQSGIFLVARTSFATHPTVEHPDLLIFEETHPPANPSDFEFRGEDGWWFHHLNILGLYSSTPDILTANRVCWRVPTEHFRVQLIALETFPVRHWSGSKFTKNLLPLLIVGETLFDE